MGADGMGAGAAGAGSAGGDNFDMYGGIDPSMDPELAMAIRASTEEARAQEEARTRAAQEASAAEGGSAATPAAPSSSSAAGNETYFFLLTVCPIFAFVLVLTSCYLRFQSEHTQRLFDCLILGALSRPLFAQ